MAKRDGQAGTPWTWVVWVCTGLCVLSLCVSLYLNYQVKAMGQRLEAYIERTERGRHLSKDDVSNLLEGHQEEFMQFVNDVIEQRPAGGVDEYMLGSDGDLHYSGVIQKDMPSYPENLQQSLCDRMLDLGILEFSVTDQGLVMLVLSRYSGDELMDQGLIYSENEISSTVSGLTTEMLSDSWYWFNWA